MLRLGIFLCIALIASAESASEWNVNADLPDIGPKISTIDKRFKVAEKQYQQIDDKNIFNTISSIMKGVYSDIKKFEDNKSYSDNNCSQYIDQVFDTVNNILDIHECDAGILKTRFQHVKSIYGHLHPDVDDLKLIEKPYPFCGDPSCSTMAKNEAKQINTMLGQVLGAKITGLNSLLDSFDHSTNYCTIDGFPNLKEVSSTYLEKINKCIKE